jgi:hypothetical protein
MEFTDWMLLKLGVLGILAFFHGVWRGATGRSRSEDPPGRRDK